MSNLGQIALFGRNYGPSKLHKSAIRKWARYPCSGRFYLKTLQHLVSRSRIFPDKIRVLLEHVAQPVRQERPVSRI